MQLADKTKFRNGKKNDKNFGLRETQGQNAEFLSQKISQQKSKNCPGKKKTKKDTFATKKNCQKNYKQKQQKKSSKGTKWSTVARKKALCLVQSHVYPPQNRPNLRESKIPPPPTPSQWGLPSEEERPARSPGWPPGCWAAAGGPPGR